MKMNENFTEQKKQGHTQILEITMSTKQFRYNKSIFKQIQKLIQKSQMEELRNKEKERANYLHSSENQATAKFFKKAEDKK